MFRIFLSLVVALSAVIAQADPVVITSGTGHDVVGMPGVFNWVDLQNSDGSIQINLSSNANTGNPINPPRFAFPGQQLNLNFDGGGSDVFGTIVIEGVSNTALANLHFVASVLTPLSAVPGQEFHLFGIFSFSGAVCYEAVFCPNSFSLVGSGLVDATVVLGPDVFIVRHVAYTFQTPEPATMLLLATGLAGIAARTRSRRKTA